MNQSEGCTSGERKGERRGRDLHKGGGGGGAEAERRREGQNSEEGGDPEGGSICIAPSSHLYCMKGLVDSRSTTVLRFKQA